MTTRTILMVDDVPMFRELADLFLARTARVMHAANAAQALDIVRSTPLSLLLVDLHMPDVDGATLCRTIKNDEALSHLPVVMLLRADDPDDCERAVAAGADDMICKPLGRSELIRVVNHFLDGGQGRGLPRVELSTPVHLRSDLFHTWGTARNISRGGINVEADCEIQPKERVSIDLVLPDTKGQISPIAEVVWSRETEDQRSNRMGLRFVSISPTSMRTISDFISEYLPTRAEDPFTLPAPRI